MVDHIKPQRTSVVMKNNTARRGFYFITLPRRLIVGAIWLYQRTLSPDHGWGRFVAPGAGCRYFPSCSEYARQTIAQQGVCRGGWRALCRLARCHPWSAGGYDPALSHENKVC